MTEFLNKSVGKEYLWSAFITFVTAFLGAVLPGLGGLPMEQGAIFALIAVGIRAGGAAVINLVATGFRTVSSK